MQSSYISKNKKFWYHMQSSYINKNKKLSKYIQKCIKLFDRLSKRFDMTWIIYQYILDHESDFLWS